MESDLKTDGVVFNDSKGFTFTFQPDNNETDNATTFNKMKKPFSALNIGGIILGVIVIVLNMSVIISVLRIPKTSKFYVTYILLGNLAVTDAGMGLWLILHYYVFSPNSETTGFLECVVTYCKYSPLKFFVSPTTSYFTSL